MLWAGWGLGGEGDGGNSRNRETIGLVQVRDVGVLK